MTLPSSFPNRNTPIAEQSANFNVTYNWGQWFATVWNRIGGNSGPISGWATPPASGTGSNATFDMNWTTTVSNPPTQAQVTAVRDQLIVVQKRLGQLLADLQTYGTIT